MAILSRSFVLLAVAGESEIAADFSVALYVSDFRPVNKTSFSQLTATLQDPFEEVVCGNSLRQ